jgi:xylan 1,4-beta-xylosidase
LPIIWSEYNVSYKTETEYTDSILMGPWLADTIRQCDGLTDMMSYWTFSDVFEEQGIVKQPFYGGYGLIAERGIHKPAFNAFQLLHKLGIRRIPFNSDSALVTRRPDGTLVFALWNLVLPGQQAGNKDVMLKIKGADGNRAVIYRVDASHGDFHAAYESMGRPASPTREQIEQLRKATELPSPEAAQLQGDHLTVTLPSNGLAVIEVPANGR